jgi:cytochrome c oxidase subunit 2
MIIDRRQWLLAAGAGAASCLVAWRVRAAAPRVIPVVARKFVFLPNDITVKRGEAVVIELTAPEVVMGFSIPQLNLRTDIIPGQVARVPLTADNVGTYDFLCDIFCGDGHEGMSGKLHVVA